MKRVTIALLIALTISLLLTGQALAHALLLRSLPEANAELLQPPAKIELWFSEPLEDGFSLVRLIDTSGDEVPLGLQTVDPNDQTHLGALVNALTPGIYTVSWTTLSRTDGHAFSGSFSFTVLNPNGSRPAGVAATLNTQERSELPTPLQTAARWLALTGSILLMGIALFFGYTAAEWMQNDAELAARLNQVGFRLMVLAVVSVVLGSWLQLITQALQLENLAQLPRLVTSTYGGALNLARQAFTVTGLLNLLWLSPQPLPPAQRRILRVAIVYTLVLVALIAFTASQSQGLIAVPALVLLGIMAVLPRQMTLLISGAATLLYFSLGSHAGAVSGSFWAISFDLIHLLATSAWAGGLMLLPLMLDRHTDPASLRPLFRRYGQVAKLSFFILWTTGLFSSLVQVPSLESLFGTPYGQVLLIKIGLMLVVWGISMTGSRLFRGKPDPEKMSVLMGRFARLAATAAWAALVLMLAVAVLVQTQPPSKENQQGSTPDYHNEITVDDLTVHLQVSPAKIGLNQFYVQLLHPDRSSIGEVQMVRLIFDEKEAQLGQAKIEMKPFGPNRYWIDGTFLNHPGHWTVSVYVRRRGLDDLIADAGMLVLDAPSTGKNPFQIPATSIPMGWLLSGALILVGLETFRWRKTFQQSYPAHMTLFGPLGWVLIGFGVLLGILIWGGAYYH